ncbi:hypothetical protein BJX96DRAFT_83834 [Aspergillus floccosus]
MKPTDQPSQPSSLAISHKSSFDAPPPPHAFEATGNSANLPDRLARIAHRIARQAVVSPEESITLHHHLDCIESLLDPTSAAVQEAPVCRPAAAWSAAALTGAADIPPPAAASPSLAQLTALLDEATALNTELQQRRDESFRLYDRLTRECHRLTRRVSELEDVLHYLKADIQEDSSEREALHGTVQGLQNWFTAWSAQHGQIVARKLSQHRRRWPRPKMAHSHENEVEALLEGIAAWMRGWNDLEEGFRARERARRRTREERQREWSRDVINTGIFIN